jgi:hypothetical protein
VGLIPDILQDPKGFRVVGQCDRFTYGGQEDLLVFFRETDEGHIR